MANALMTDIPFQAIDSIELFVNKFRYSVAQVAAVYPAWGAHDAYNAGDIVDYNGTLYKSLIDGNTWSPEAMPDGWEVYTP